MPAAHRGQGSSLALAERLVLASFASPAGLTRSELEELTGLSRTVVSGVVTALLERGELVEARPLPAPGTRGRPPARYQRAALVPPVLLIRLAKDETTSVSLVNGDGSGSQAYQCGSWSGSWRGWSASVADAARQLRSITQAPPRAAVFSVPFPVAERRGAPRFYPVELEDLRALGAAMPRRSPWLERDPRPALTSALGCTVLMVNDANLAALGEARFGAGRGRRAVVHVCVADGIGAGFVFDGRLFTGAHGFSGELVHVQVNPDGRGCLCGGHGCLATEILAMARETGTFPEPDKRYGSLVGRALAPLVTMLDPDCVVIDARLGPQAKPFAAGVTTELARRCPADLGGSVAVVGGELTDAERFGAIAAADGHAAMLLPDLTRLSYR